MVQLISEEYIKSEGLIDDNLWGKYLGPAITLAQEKGLQQLIGENLYVKICGLVENGEIKIIQYRKYKHLLDDYILPYLLWQTMVESSVTISWKFKNQGLIEANNDYVTRPSMKDFQYIRQNYVNNAEFYGKKMTDYLNANCNNYPEYHTHECGKINAEHNDFNIGIYLG